MKLIFFFIIFLLGVKDCRTQIKNEIHKRKKAQIWEDNHKDTIKKMANYVNNYKESDSVPNFFLIECLEIEYAFLRESYHSFESVRKKIIEQIVNPVGIVLLLKNHGNRLKTICSKNDLLVSQIPNLNKNFFELLLERLNELLKGVNTTK